MLCRNPITAILNALVQIVCILLSGYDVVWAMYPVIGMMIWIGFMQTVAAASILSGFVTDDFEREEAVYDVPIAIGLIYFVSAYEVYSIGLGYIAGFMVAHALIFVLTNVFALIDTYRENYEDEE